MTASSLVQEASFSDLSSIHLQAVYMTDFTSQKLALLGPVSIANHGARSFHIAGTSQESCAECRIRLQYLCARTEKYENAVDLYVKAANAYRNSAEWR